MTVKELYRFLDNRIPRALSCEWDNDGLMCSPDLEREVKCVLLALDVTKDTVKFAKECGADVILTHHPLIFKPLKCVNDELFAANKVIRLLDGGVSVFSFHTRLDALRGGVNDALAEKLCVREIEALPDDPDMIGRIGYVNETEIGDFAAFVKEKLGCRTVKCIDSGRKVVKVALCGGDGKDLLKAAYDSGADTYVTGTMSYNSMLDAYDMGINVIEAGHYYTEAPVLDKLCAMIKEADGAIVIRYFDSNAVKVF